MPEPQAMPSPMRAVLADELVGRGPELDHLRAAVEAARDRRGGLVFLVGEPGIGKSRVARALAADATARGLVVLWGRSAQGSGAVPYRAIAEALSATARAGIIDRGAVAPFRANLAHLVPAWREDDDAGLDVSLVAMVESILQFLVAAAGDRGAVLVLEDLHWSDPETLAILDYLGDHVVGERILVVATIRDERSPGLDLARSLVARRAAAMIELAPLRRDDVAAMVRSCLSTRDLPEEILRFVGRADGIPFMVEELLTAALASGALVEENGAWRLTELVGAVVPQTFAENLRRRVAQLGQESERVLTAAAVLGRQFTWELLPAMTGLDQDTVLAALHDATEAQIVTFDRHGNAFWFRHALSKDAVLAALFPPELERLCRQGLLAIEAEQRDPGEGWVELAAELAVGAGEHERAAALLLAAGRRALRKGALRTAEATLERARALLADGHHETILDVEDCLLRVLSLAGNRERAVEVATTMLDRLRTEPEQVRRRVEIHLQVARAALAATQWQEAEEALGRAGAEMAPVAGLEELAARLDALRAQHAIVRDPARAPAHAQAALAAAERLGLADVACEALEILGRGHRSRDLAAAEEAFARALRLAEANHLTVWRARALQELGAIDMLQGRPLARLEEAREIASAQGALATAAVVDVQLAAALVMADDPEPGAEVARRSAALSRRYHLDQTLAAAVALEAYVHARAGRREEMQRCIAEARTRAPAAADIEVKTSTAAAVLALVEEDRATARAHLCAGLRSVVRAGGDCSVVPGVGLLTLLRAVDGGNDDAPEVPVPERSVHFLAGAFLDYAKAVEAGGRGDAIAADRLLRAGDAALHGHRWFRHLGRRLAAEAAVAGGWGDPVPWLLESLGFFDGNGDERIASACRSLLRRAGAAVPRRRGDTPVPDGLRAAGVTAREVEVLRLLAVGLPNSEIAGRLYLSPRTVERHVSNLAVKTGLARRAELVAFAARTFGDAAVT